MTNAPALFPAPAHAAIVTDLAANMIGLLLVDGPNAPIQRLVREALMDDEAKMAWELRDCLIEATNARQINEAVASYVGFILHRAARAAQTDMGAR